MWTREQLKTRAKDVLRKSYWWAFLVCLVFTLISGFGNSSSNTVNRRINTSSSGYQSSVDISSLAKEAGLNKEQTKALQDIVDTYGSAASTGASVGALVISFVIKLFNIAFSIFVIYPLTVGYNRYFLDQSAGNVNFGTLFSGFTGGKYMARVKTMFFKSLYTFLWSLLFIIPGIIKGYSYFLIPYIIADNPDISTDRAFEISMKTMDGEKWDCFVLQLSFLGWQLLGLLCCCIGIYFVNPYQQATMAEFYITMRQKAIDKGIASAEEFNLTYTPADPAIQPII